MKANGGFLVTKIKQLGDRIFDRILAGKDIDAFNGPQGRILYVLWQEDGVPITTVSEKSGLIRKEQSESDKRKTLLYLTDTAKALRKEYDAVSDEMGKIYYDGFTDDEIKRFEEYLERILSNLEGWSGK